MNNFMLQRTWRVQSDWAARALFVCVAGAGLALALALFVPAEWRGDWRVFWEAARATAHGQSPYTVAGFYNPVWALLPVWLAAPAGNAIAYGVWVALNIGALIASALRLGARPFALALILLSPLTLNLFVLSNNEPLAYMGLLLPPPLGIFFLMLKPQILLGAIVVLAWRAWRQARARGLVRLFAPVGLALMGTVVVFGFWMRGADVLVDAYWNLSPFPLLVPVGLFLLWRAVRTDDIHYALPAGLCLSPYFAFYSLTLVGLALVRAPRWLLLWFVAQWAVALYGVFFGQITIPRLF